MLPLIDVAVTVARSIGKLSGPVTRPRMMSLDCASAADGWTKAAINSSAATENSSRRRLTVRPEGVGGWSNDNGTAGPGLRNAHRFDPKAPAMVYGRPKGA